MTTSGDDLPPMTYQDLRRPAPHGLMAIQITVIGLFLAACAWAGWALGGAQ